MRFLCLLFAMVPMHAVDIGAGVIELNRFTVTNGEVFTYAEFGSDDDGVHGLTLASRAGGAVHLAVMEVLPSMYAGKEDDILEAVVPEAAAGDQVAIKRVDFIHPTLRTVRYVVTYKDTGAGDVVCDVGYAEAPGSYLVWEIDATARFYSEHARALDDLLLSVTAK